MLDQDQTEATETAQLPRNKDGSIRKTFVKSVARRIETGDASGLRDLVGDLHEADMGALIEALEPEQRPRLVSLLGIDFDFTALTEVDDAVRDEILDELPSQAVAKGVSELESDDAVAILEDLPKDEQAEILEQLPQPDRAALARSLDYPEESAGRRMQTEFIAVPPAWNVGQAIDYMRETQELPERFFELYVTDEGGHFVGAVPLDRLLRSKRPVPVSDLMERERHRIRAARRQTTHLVVHRHDLVHREPALITHAVAHLAPHAIRRTRRRCRYATSRSGPCGSRCSGTPPARTGSSPDRTCFPDTRRPCASTRWHEAAVP